MPLADDCPIPDPLELLSYLAAATERIVLGTGVLVLPEHNPVLLAKRLATLDVLSGGRARLGVGVGWLREEAEAVGIDPATRGARSDEMIEALRVLWREDEPTFHGDLFSFERAMCRPRPLQSGGVPIHVGGHSPAAARRAGRFGDGYHPLGLDEELLRARLAQLRTAALAADRDADRIELTLGGLLERTDAASVEAAAQAGADRLVLSTTTADPEELGAQLAACRGAGGSRSGLTTPGRAGPGARAACPYRGPAATRGRRDAVAARGAGVDRRGWRRRRGPAMLN
ncbi:MAG: TIGR03619 family F420-dependent LLM class oxidoreductase [Acidimicrobiia bacterium]|nr:TIGR03619 family F420-dependent LLM class oxidoreductase [Acidimicrobiia bacterium]